jgi:hypothetical protein
MSLFSRKPLTDRSLGVTFPFIEQKDGALTLRYDALRVEVGKETVSVVFLQEGVEIYAFTEYAQTPSTLTFDGLEGKVNINIVSR